MKLLLTSEHTRLILYFDSVSQTRDTSAIISENPPLLWLEEVKCVGVKGCWVCADLPGTVTWIISPSGGSVLILFKGMQSPEGPAEIQQFILPELPSVCGFVFYGCVKQIEAGDRRVFELNGPRTHTFKRFPKSVNTALKTFSFVPRGLKYSVTSAGEEFVWSTYLLHSPPGDSHTHWSIWEGEGNTC